MVVPGRGHPEHPRQGHRHSDHRGPAAANRPRHRRRTRRPRRRIRRRLPAGLRPGTHQRRAARRPSPTPCRTPSRCGSTRSSPPWSTRPGRRSTRPTAPPASCSPNTAPRSASSTTRVQALFDAVARPDHPVRLVAAEGTIDAPGAAGHGRLRVVPRSGDRRLHRRRLLRPGRPDRLRQVDRHRRDDLRPLRHGPALAGQADGDVRAGADRGPRHRPAGVRRRAPALRRRPRVAARQGRRGDRSKVAAWKGFSTPRPSAPSTT